MSYLEPEMEPDIKVLEPGDELVVNDDDIKRLRQ